MFLRQGTSLPARSGAKPLGGKVKTVRIDKFLKVSRVVKRRTVAAGDGGGGTRKVHGKPAKPAKEVKVGDTVKVSFGAGSLTFEVLDVSEKQSKQSASEMYRIIGEE